MKKILSHEEVAQKMYSTILSKLVADNILRKEDEISCEINGQRFIIIAPVGIKQTPSLEKKLEEYTSEDIATAIIFPKSSERYEGNYLKNAGKYSSGEGDHKVCTGTLCHHSTRNRCPRS